MTAREQRAQRITHATHSSLTIECLHCQCKQSVDRDEDGGGEIDQQPCHADDCAVMLCKKCNQFICEHCGLAHCSEHANTDSDSVKVCDVCKAELMEEEAHVDCYCAGDHCDCGRGR